MHDPLVVAFEIRRPWPKRVNWHKQRWYWPSVITVWHREPGGRDSGEVCKHYDRIQDADGKWRTKFRHAWRFHIHHWKIQIGPLQKLRRWLLTRCAWCGGKHRKGDPVHFSHQWDSKRGPWWRGETGLFHEDCSSVEAAHRACLCGDPLTSQDGYGSCLLCGKFRAFNAKHLDRQRILASIPTGQRDPVKYRQVCDMYAAELTPAADGTHTEGAPE